MRKRRHQSSPAQTCFEYMCQNPGRKVPVGELVTQQWDLPNGAKSAAANILKTRRRMGYVRRLFRDQRQLCLYGDGDYWVARPEVDAVLVRARIRAVILRKHSSANLARLELTIAEEGKLLPREMLVELRKQL
jgi:hypothetical protein